MKLFKISQTLLILFIFLVSCQKNDNNFTKIKNTNQPQIKNPQKTIGDYHNEIILYYFDHVPITYQNYDCVSYNELQRVDSVFKDYLLQENFNEVNIDSAIANFLSYHEQIKTFYYFNEIKYLNNEKFTNDTNYINFLVENNYISYEFKQEVDTILTFISNNESHDFILNYVNDLKTKNWSDTEIEYVNVFIDVFNKSSELWLNSKQKAPGDDVIIADAIGAIHGLIWGPLGSIIEGALVSIAQNNNWWE